jgi:sec-independent protein translocase protein TatB
MPQVGPLEIIVVAVLALIVFGPQRLPEIARTIGKFLNEARRMANEVKSEFKEGLDDPVEDEVNVPGGRDEEAGMTEAPEPGSSTPSPDPASEPPGPGTEDS